MNSLQKEEMFAEITEFFGCSIDTRTRKREILDIRHCWRVAMRKLGYTSKEVGQMTGHDHSTVLNSEKVVLELCKESEDYNSLYTTMLSLLQGFHRRKGIAVEKTDDSKNTLFLFIDLLDYMSEHMPEEEREKWIAAAGISMGRYRSILQELKD